MDNKIALVTGCCKRIGKEIVLHLAKKKYFFIIHYNSSDYEAKHLKNHLKNLNIKSKIIKYDFSNTQNIIQFSNKCYSKFGKIDLLINNASIFEKDDLNIKRIKKQFNINMISPILLSVELGKLMQKDNGGNIINIGDSVAVKNPWKSFMSYSISKSYIQIFTKSLNKELKNNVRVNSIELGPILKPNDKKIKNIYKNKYKSKNGINSILNSIDYILENKFVNGKNIMIENAESLMTSSN